MAAIATQGTGLRHVRKTINFDGGANNGNLGDTVPAFTTTGEVFVTQWVARVTEDFACAAKDVTGIALGPPSGDGLFNKANLNDDDGDLLATGVTLVTDNAGGTRHGVPSTDGLASVPGVGQSSGGILWLNGNLGLIVTDAGGGADITNGQLRIDLWYYPITDDGALAGDDIDTELVAAIRKQQMTELYAADGVAPTMEQALFEILQVLTEMVVVGTTATVKKLDGSTTAFTLTLNDANTPTGITRAT